MYLSDDKEDSGKWQFPADTKLATDAYLLVWADDDDGDSPGLHTNFKLTAKGESVVLFDTDANGNTLIDAVDFPALDEDEAYGRMPNGSGALRILPATPGAANPIIPALSIVAEGSAVEGATAVFMITADPAPDVDLAVDVSVTQEAGVDFLPASPPESVTIAANSEEAALEVALPDDAVDESDGAITATIQPSPEEKYDVAADDSATITVQDNDLPPAPLTAELLDVPATHDGEQRFNFELRFSDDVTGRPGDPFEWVDAIEVGNGTLRGAESMTGESRRWDITIQPDGVEDVTITLPATQSCLEPKSVCTADGRPLSNSVSATVASVAPLTAAFDGVPEEHDGTSFVSTCSSTRLRSSATRCCATRRFDITGGRVTRARRFEGRDDRREIHVEPTGCVAVTVSLPATTDCSASGAICTADGRSLSNSVSATVASVAPLTAAFDGMPEEHDGTNPFSFELRFSEDPGDGVDEGLLGQRAFRVTNGSIDRAERVEAGQNRRWTLHVLPESYEDVTVELPATTDCDAAGAVCAEDGR